MDIEEIEQNNDNKEIILKAVQENGKNLDLASNRLKDDEEIVKTALEQDGESLELQVIG